MTKSSSKSQRAADIASYEGEIYYSPRYDDGKHEYRHVVLPKQLAKYVIPNRTMTEDEWRSIGVRQSPGWTHYMIHAPEPHILLFRRDIDPVPLTESAGGMAF